MQMSQHTDSALLPALHTCVVSNGLFTLEGQLAIANCSSKYYLNRKEDNYSYHYVFNGETDDFAHRNHRTKPQVWIEHSALSRIQSFRGNVWEPFLGLGEKLRSQSRFYSAVFYNCPEGPRGVPKIQQYKADHYRHQMKIILLSTYNTSIIPQNDKSTLQLKHPLNWAIQRPGIWLILDLECLQPWPQRQVSIQNVFKHHSHCTSKIAMPQLMGSMHFCATIHTEQEIKAEKNPNQRRAFRLSSFLHIHLTHCIPTAQRLTPGTTWNAFRTLWSG